MELIRTHQGDGVTTRLYNFANLDEKLRKMRGMITEDRENPVVRNQAVSIIKDAGCMRGDKKDQALAIGEWVQNNCYYVHEFPERLAHAYRTIKDKAGDCDDFDIAIIAMMESLGIPGVQVCMNIDGEWKHIFPAAMLLHKKGPPTYLPLDATMRNPIRNVVNPIQWAHERGRAVNIKLA